MKLVGIGLIMIGTGLLIHAGIDAADFFDLRPNRIKSNGPPAGLCSEDLSEEFDY